MTYYKYNQVELPALPTYDKVKYPYAAIGVVINDKGAKYFDYGLFLSESSFKMSDNKIVLDTTKSYLLYGYDIELDSLYWTPTSLDEGTITGSTTINNVSPIIWSNQDIYLTDGTTIALKGTEAIPSFLYNKNAFLQGIACGLCGEGVKNNG